MILDLLRSRFELAVSEFVDDVSEYIDLVRYSQDVRFGDYQANIAMPLAKRLSRKPREVADEIISRLRIDDICDSVEVAGAGFINIVLRDSFLAECLCKVLADVDRMGIEAVKKPKKFVVDYSGPNVAKPMHVGHLRSTVLGNALTNILRFRGHSVVTDNHLGDWGTQFGMIIFGYKNYLDADLYCRQPVEELSRIYRFVRGKIDAGDQEVAANVLAETAKLHDGNADNLKIWHEVMPYSMNEIDLIYRRLGITFDYTLGESFYHPMLSEVVDDLIGRGIARETDGAIGIFFDGSDTPMLIRKKDGAYLYGTTDIATILYRMREFKPDVILYLTDFRQSLHFEQLFKTARMMGINEVEFAHVKFGAVLGEDGKPFKTRSGDTVGLNGLLDEAEKRALEIVKSNDRSKLSDDNCNEVAKSIGIGGIIYADLSQNRESDYIFSYDKMLAMNGNTAAYMQYAYARVRSIFAKGNIDVKKFRKEVGTDGFKPELKADAERMLAKEILKFGDAIDFAIKDYRPNLLTAYLFELANKYSTFFEQCPVLRAENELTRNSRLLLCDLTATTLKKGLELLGIKTVERM
ncbi:MAG: arginine--tRNA ligase [Planctomycetaceae bacterium]|jgi:arginyl-tRNA synthetase|nr:arginine--tRNA ligase [Planctomycetaceae bacterium]